MAKHEFALMDHVPQKGVRYDTYDAPHMNCVSVHDDDVERYLTVFDHIPTYAHTVDVPYQGLCYCGITLIPPQAAHRMRCLTEHDPAFSALHSMLDAAEHENRWIIHFGI